MEQVSDSALPGEAGQARPNGRASTVFSIRMICGGEEQSIDLPIDQAMIGQLALEAEIRDMRIGELLAALIIAILKTNSLGPLLQQHPKRKSAASCSFDSEGSRSATGTRVRRRRGRAARAAARCRR